MSVDNFRYLIYLFWLCIVLSAFLFPAQVESTHCGFCAAGEVFAEVRYFKQTSHFPAALSMTYLIAVVFGCVLAFVAITSKDIFRRTALIFGVRGRLLCFLHGALSLLVLLWLMFVEKMPDSSERGRLFLLSMSENRSHLALWCSAIFMLVLSSLVVFVSSLIGFFIRGVLNEQR